MSISLPAHVDRRETTDATPFILGSIYRLVSRHIITDITSWLVISTEIKDITCGLSSSVRIECHVVSNHLIPRIPELINYNRDTMTT